MTSAAGGARERAATQRPLNTGLTGCTLSFIGSATNAQSLIPRAARDRPGPTRDDCGRLRHGCSLLLRLPVEAADQIGSGERGYFSKVPRMIMGRRSLTIFIFNGEFYQGALYG